MGAVGKFKINFFIGGFHAESFKIFNKGNSLVVQQSEGPIFPDSDKRTFIVKENDWEKFWISLDKSNIWDWEKEYFSEIMDGVQWELKIVKDEKRKTVYGSNKFPENFQIFLNALNRISGLNLEYENF